MKSFLKIVELVVVATLIAISLASCQKDEAQQIFDTGLAYWKVGKYDEAVQNLITLNKTYPDNPLVDDALFWIANIYEHYLNDPEQAIRYYRTLNSRFEGSEFYLKSMIGLGRVRAQEGDDGKQKAIRIFRKLQKYLESQGDKEQWAENQMRLAHLLFDLKQYERARIELKQVILKNTSAELVAKAYYLIGRSYYLQNDLDLARITFMEADRKFNHKKISLASAINLADILEQTGELTSAIAVYETILDRLERREVFYQLADDRIKKLKLRLKKVKTG